MEQLKVELSQSGAMNPKGSIEVLIAAMDDIRSSTEADFEALKSRKWYNRLWNIISFKKEDETVLATDVSSLAKLDEIVMTALFEMANENEEYHNVISESLGKIENLDNRLRQVSDALSKVALEILNIKCGYHRSLSFTDLKSSEKENVRNFFYQYARKLEDLNPNKASQKLYAQAVEGHFPNADSESFGGVDLLRPEVQQFLYRLDQSYFYLISGKFDDSERFDDFCISRNLIKQIQAQITEAIRLCGVDYFISSLIQTEEVDYIDNEGIVFIDDDIETEWQELEDEIFFDEETDDEPQELEEYIIDCIKNVEENERLALSNKEIHIKSFVNCKGSIWLDHCTVYYNESENADEIKLFRDAEFIATDCSFICKGYDEHSFIDGYYNIGEAIFERCNFYDCSNFIGSVSSLKIDDCTLENCGVGFVKSVCKYDIQNNKIVLEKMADFNLPEARKNGEVLRLWSKSDSNTFSNIEAEYKEDAYSEDFRFSLLVSLEGAIANSTFRNIKNCVRATTIQQCLFEDCENCITLENEPFHNELKGKVVSSDFNRCKHCIETDSENVVSQCRFDECTGKIIVCEDGTGISFCEFINCRNEELEPIFSTSASILIRGRKKGKHSYIKNCVFDGIVIEEGFLVATKISENTKSPIVTISDCDFRNCWTNKDNGEIICTMDSYYPALSKKKKVIQTITISCCRGLDKVSVNTAKRKKLRHFIDRL